MNMKRFEDTEIDVLDVIKREIGKVEDTIEKVDEFYRRDLKKLDRLSDRIAEFGGSWTFIAIFFILLFSWMAINTWILVTQSWDPYPFILLNLILSCLAAIQAPVILMSQSRAAKRDKARVELDLEKDLRDLHIDEGSHKLLLEIRHDVEKIKKKLHSG